MTITRPSRGGASISDRIMPTECRQASSTYAGPAQVTVVVRTSKGTNFQLQRTVGRIPIMVRSSKCWLHGLPPSQLVAQHEARPHSSSPLLDTPVYTRACAALQGMTGPDSALQDATEPGGYFIVNGNEKLVRMLIVPRRNTVFLTPLSFSLSLSQRYVDI